MSFRGVTILGGIPKCFIGGAPSPEKVETRKAMRRAFDKAFRRRPLAFAADAVYGN